MEAKKANAWEDKAREGSTVGEKANVCSHYKKFYGDPLKQLKKSYKIFSTYNS